MLNVVASLNTPFFQLFRVDRNSPDNIPIPDGWLRCDGSIIPAPSPWVNLTTPNLNGEKRFLRGGSPAEILIFQGPMFKTLLFVTHKWVKQVRMFVHWQASLP
jgi:hypothetical protein